MPFTCPVCGKEHEELPDIGWDAPYQWADSLADDPDSLLARNEHGLNVVLVRLEDDEYRARSLQAKGQLGAAQAKLRELTNGSRPEEKAAAHARHRG